MVCPPILVCRLVDEHLLVATSLLSLCGSASSGILCAGHGWLGVRISQETSEDPLSALLLLPCQLGFLAWDHQIPPRFTLPHMADHPPGIAREAALGRAFGEQRVLNRVLPRSTCARPFSAGARWIRPTKRGHSNGTSANRHATCGGDESLASAR